MKKIGIILGLLFIAVCAFAQAPDWQWATKAGGNSNDYGFGIAIDNAGNCYVTGGFKHTATFGSYSLTSSGLADIFVAKMDANGNWLWATKAGGTDNDRGIGITIDDDGNSYVTGYFGETATFGSYSLTSNGYIDIFVAKMDAIGNWQWATKAGGISSDRGFGTTTDNSGNIYVTGEFRETATFGSYSLISSGYVDIFVAKMDADGNWLWGTQSGGSGYDYGWGITIDQAGNNYVTGWFEYTATFGSYSLTSSGYTDIFVAKVDAIGNWQWAAQAGEISSDQGFGITTDNAGNIYVTGEFRDIATFGSYSLISSGYTDIFVAKMDSIGNWLWATKAGGSYSDYGYAITIDNAGNSYVTGVFEDTATFGSYSLTSSGWGDIFVAKMDATGNWLWATKAGGIDDDVGLGITIDDAGNIYMTGYFKDTATFGSYSLTSSGYTDIFVAKLNSSVFAENEIIPTEMGLSNYPNPFKPSTTIYFSVTQMSPFMNLEIYNIKGQKIKTFLSFPNWGLGTRSVVWDGTDENNQPVSSGIYLYKLVVNNKTKAVKKMILLR
ncbi:MAG: SBBP repeat-containing protein [Candidatus Cloacimonetes bacterium]|nr:SBBP repeat-containing protein [Candidatus Cloacimonadota bacterium]